MPQNKKCFDELSRVAVEKLTTKLLSSENQTITENTQENALTESKDIRLTTEGKEKIIPENICISTAKDNFGGYSRLEEGLEMRDSPFQANNNYSQVFQNEATRYKLTDGYNTSKFAQEKQTQEKYPDNLDAVLKEMENQMNKLKLDQDLKFKINLVREDSEEKKQIAHGAASPYFFSADRISNSKFRLLALEQKIVLMEKHLYELKKEYHEILNNDIIHRENTNEENETGNLKREITSILEKKFEEVLGNFEDKIKSSIELSIRNNLDVMRSQLNPKHIENDHPEMTNDEEKLGKKADSIQEICEQLHSKLIEKVLD